MKFLAYILEGVIIDVVPFCLIFIVMSCVFGQQPKQAPKMLEIKLKDTDIVSIVMTVKTARALTAALTSKVLPDQQVANAAVAALVRAVDGPFMTGPVQNKSIGVK
jgi:hypothetical protein